MSRPMAGESYEAYRARMKAEEAGQPAPDAGFEAQKAKVAAQHARGGQPTAPGKRVVDVDSAAADADELEAHRDRQKHEKGVVKIDKAAADAAYKADASFASKKPEEQAAVARSVSRSSDAPAGVKHTTETPGATHQTSMAAALSKAGVQGSAPKQEAPKRTPSPAPSAAVNAQNNMGAPRGSVDTSVVAGRAVTDSGEAARARAAAEKGKRKNGGVRESAPAPVAAPQAPRAVQESQQLPGGRFSTKPRAEAFSHVLGIASEAGPSSKLSDKPATPAPATNPAPHAPVASAPNSGGTAADRFHSRDLVTRESIGAGKPKLGTDITYGVNNPKSPASKMREGYNAHIAGDGNAESYWAARDAKKAAGKAPKAAKSAPKEVVAETPSVAAAPAKAPAKAASAAPQGPLTRIPAADLPGEAPSRAPQAQKTPLSSQMTISGEGRETSNVHGNWGPSSPVSPGRGPLAQKVTARYSPERMETPAANVNPTPETPVAPKATGTTRSTGRVGTVSETAPGTRSAARAGGVSGGEHSINVGGDNHGTITNNHNTYNVNYGSVGGNMGNIDHGYAPRGGAVGHGGGTGQSRPGNMGHAGSEHHGKADVWVKDRSGTHSLRGTIDHVTGRTNGDGHHTAAAKAAGAHGGAQKPMKGSARANTGGSQMVTNQGTGTTHNWQGPQAGVTHPASGIGTANHGQTTP